jgi:alpha-galactosidase
MDINGHDGLKLLREYYHQHPEFDYVVEDKVPEDLLYSGGVNPGQKIKFDFLERTGYLPAAGDAHIAEFFSHFLTDEDTANRWGVGGNVHTFAHQKGFENRRQKVLRMLNGEEPLWLQHSHEHASRVIAALSGGKEIVTPVNVANIGQIDNLPRQVVVETQALVDRLGIHPLPVGTLPEIITQFLMKHIPVQEMIVQAGLTGDKELAIQALTCDPLIPNPDVAVKIVEDFFCEFSSVMPQFK